jgi:hypothetical protein
VRQLLVESLLVAGTGAALGLLIARWGGRLIVSQLSTVTNLVVLDSPVDWRVLAFTGVATVVTALLFGTAPALRAAGAPPLDAMKEHGRGSIGDPRVRLGNSLIVAQVAVSVVLVVAAGLFLRTFASLARLPTGFAPGPVLLVHVNAQPTQIAPADRLAAWEQVRQQVTAVPGVAAAALSFVTPVSGSVWNMRVTVSDGLELPERERATNFNAVSPG